MFQAKRSLLGTDSCYRYLPTFGTVQGACPCLVQRLDEDLSQPFLEASELTDINPESF